MSQFCSAICGLNLSEKVKKNVWGQPRSFIYCGDKLSEQFATGVSTHPVLLCLAFVCPHRQVTTLITLSLFKIAFYCKRLLFLQCAINQHAILLVSDSKLTIKIYIYGQRLYLVKLIR